MAKGQNRRGASNVVPEGADTSRPQKQVDIEVENGTSPTENEIEMLRLKAEIQSGERQKEREHQLLLLEQGFDTAMNTTNSSELIDKYVHLLKNLMSGWSKDADDLISYFKMLESAFASYQVPECLRGRLVAPLLGSKARDLILKLTPDELGDYVKV